MSEKVAHLRDDNTRLEQDRDAARAEVERLKADWRQVGDTLSLAGISHDVMLHRIQSMASEAKWALTAKGAIWALIRDIEAGSVLVNAVPRLQALFSGRHEAAASRPDLSAVRGKVEALKKAVVAAGHGAPCAVLGYNAEECRCHVGPTIAAFSEILSLLDSAAPVPHLPAQMGEVRGRLLQLKKMCVDNGGDVVERRAVETLVDSALAVLPVQHDDQQGGTAGPFVLSLAKLRSANEQRQKEWDAGNQIDLAYRGNEFAGEVGEALEQAVDVILMAAAAGRASNVIKKLERERLGIRGSRATRQQLQEELADVVICVDLIAMATEIDLGEAVTQKFNATSEKVGLATRLGPVKP